MLKLGKPMLLKAEEKKPVKKVKLEYIDVLESVTLELDDTTSLVFGVSKLGEDGEPHVDIRTWIDTEAYTGPTKKGINFSMNELDNILEILTSIKEALNEDESEEQ